MVSTNNLGIILIACIFIIAIVLVFLLIREKKSSKKTEGQDWNAFYMSEIEKIQKSSPKKILNFIDKITRDFFREAFKIGKFVGYAELKKIFSRRNNEKAVEFCDLMSKSLYSKEEDGEKIQKIINLLIELIEANQPKEKIEKG